MKRSIILPVIAVVLLLVYALFINYVSLLIVAAFLLAVYIIEAFCRKETDNAVKPSELTVEDLTAQYGQPEDVILLNAARANEALGVILVYKDFFIVEGQKIDKNSITDVTFNNSGTPYAPGEYQIIIATNNPTNSYIHVNSGYDVSWTKDVTEEIKMNL